MSANIRPRGRTIEGPRRRLNVYLDDELHRQIRSYAEFHNLSDSAATRELLEQQLKHLREQRGAA